MVDVLGVIPSDVLRIGFQFLTKQLAVNVPKNWGGILKFIQRK